MYGVLGSPPVESAWGGTNREGASEWSQAYDFGDGYTSIASGSSADTRASTWSWAETYDELYETFYVESYGEILVVTDPLAIRTVRDSASWSSTDNSEGSVYAGTGPAGSSSTNRTWQSSHDQSREFHSEDWWTPLGGSHESTTLEGWSSGGEQSWSYSGPDGSWSIGGTWSDAVTPPAVENSWSWGTTPAGPLVAPEYAGPDDADYGDLISAIAAESLGAYNQPATRDAAVDAAIVAFVSLDADDQGQGGGEMYAETREAGEEGGESVSFRQACNF